MSKQPLTATPEAKKRKARQTAVAERRIDGLHINLKLLLEPLDDQKVRIVEYHRKRDDEQRWHRVKEQEGQVYDYAKLKLTHAFEELFPQAELFTAAD